MNGTFSAFPRGSGGLALLLLRLSTGLVLVAENDAMHPSSVAARLGMFVLAAALGVGLFTRSAAILAAPIIAVGFGLLNNVPCFALALYGLVAIALALSGAGAYSIDSILFGRRIIELGK